MEEIIKIKIDSTLLPAYEALAESSGGTIDYEIESGLKTYALIRSLPESDQSMILSIIVKHKVSL